MLKTVSLLIVIIVLSWASTEAVPVGSVGCGGGYVVFTSNYTQNGMNFTKLSVVGAANMSVCATEDVVDGTLTLRVKPQDCDVTPEADGTVNMQFLISQHSGALTQNDGLSNVTCNVSAAEDTKGWTFAMSVTGTIDTKVAEKPIPTSKLVAKDGADTVTNTIGMGADLKLCVETYLGPASAFKSMKVLDCSMDGVDFLKDGCKITGGAAGGQAKGGFTSSAANQNKQEGCVTIKAFRSRQSLNEKDVVVKCDVMYQYTVYQQDGTTCPAKRRKRDVTNVDSRDSGDLKPLVQTIKLTLNVEDEKEQEPAMDVCEGHVANTVFYAVVAILAVLLLLTIGVAVYFGTRSRVIIAGKENPAF